MNWTIQKKLYAMVAALSVLLLLLGGITYERFGRTAEIEDELNTAHRIEGLSSEMERGILEARRREKDFFARQGEAKYRELVAKEGAAFLKTSADLKQLIQHTGRVEGRSVASFASIDDDMREYLSAFEKAADTFHERGLPDTGAQGRMRKAAHEIERLAEQLKNPQTKIALLQMRRSEKDFLLRNDPKYPELVATHITEIENSLKSGDDDAEDRRRIRELLHEYSDSFAAVVDASKRLEALHTTLHEAHTRMEPKLHELSAESERRSSELLAEVHQVREHAIWTLSVVFLIVLVMGAVAVGWVSRQIAVGISELVEGTKRVATGDLTTPVNLNRSDELGLLAASFNQMVSGLKDLNSRINETSNSLATIATELNATVSEQSASVQQQAAAVTETVSTIEEMTRSASGVAEIAQTVSSTASSSVEASSRGEAALKQSIEGMLSIREQVQNIASTILELSERTQQIGGIIATVDDFAEQSSLLALNASIEAARAGEQGRAFSVVAAEIKKLAEQSQQATDKVRGILGEIQRATHSAVMVTEEGSKRVDRGVGFVETAGSIVMELVETIKGSSRSAKQIAAAAQQQASGVEQVSTAMTGIDQSSRQNVAAIRQTEAASQTLANITRELQKTTARYRLA
jgi:methyl-accepting chemotaxis protein